MRTALLSLILLGGGIARADDWPQWLGPKRDGVWREDGLIDTFPADGPKKLWEKPVGIGYGGPAVAGGKLFLMDRVLGDGVANPTNPFDRQSRVGGSERVLCLDAKTGDQLWKYEYPCTYQISYAAGPRCTPTVDGDKVYALGAMGDLTCLDAGKGTLVWKKNFVTDFDARVPVWGFACHPLVDGDNLICVAGGSDNRLVIAFDKNTGKVNWAKQSCEGDFGYCPPVIYEFGGKRQLIVWHARALLGLDPKDGTKLWGVPWDLKASLNVPMPRKVGDDGLFVTSFYHGSMFLKITDGIGRVVWKSAAKGEMPNQTRDLSAIMCTPVIDGDYTFGVCSHGELRGLVTATGERKWTTMQATRGKRTPAAVAENPEPNTQSERWGHAFIVKQADRYVLFNEQGDLIFAKLSPTGYEELSRAHLIDPTNTMARGRKVVWMHPAFADKCVFVRNDEQLMCYSLAK
ncbi:outer membrane protein assembly factor BamB family protein [Limnoglobus roseus]|uniref:Pyrrolo-quinoline quinone n=1 Tax=Limnoglobus roseus TaxID=2598579 RepID=A0A5C1ALV6_9BACT|nr:PQQ-binding-like beta-propeller repeat protein [Limnoglobus roseus]QEL18154.1 pyrrolo-quinoline quinone [Limnoglobus roseus]